MCFIPFVCLFLQEGGGGILESLNKTLKSIIKLWVYWELKREDKEIVNNMIHRKIWNRYNQYKLNWQDMLDKLQLYENQNMTFDLWALFCTYQFYIKSEMHVNATFHPIPAPLVLLWTDFVYQIKHTYIQNVIYVIKFSEAHLS